MPEYHSESIEKINLTFGEMHDMEHGCDFARPIVTFPVLFIQVGGELVYAQN